jgi:hypothetical protein
MSNINFRTYSGGNDIDLFKDLYARVIKIENVIGITPTSTEIVNKPITLPTVIVKKPITPSAVTADKSITTAQIADKSITTAQIADKSITTAQIADKSITTAQIADKSITTAQIANKSITTAQIADKSITTAQIANKSIQYSNVQEVTQPALLGSVSGGSVSEVQIHSSLVLDISGFLGINYGMLYQNEEIAVSAHRNVIMKHGFSCGQNITVETNPNFIIQVSKKGIYKISFGCTITSPTEVYLTLYKNINDIVVSKLFCTKTNPTSRELFCLVEADDIFRLMFNKNTDISDAFLMIQRIN